MTKKERLEHNRRVGAISTPAKRRAARRNGKLGGRPVKLARVQVRPDWPAISVHADAVIVGQSIAGQPLLAARTGAAAQWLRRHGYEHGEWEAAEERDDWPAHGKTWRPA